MNQVFSNFIREKRISLHEAGDRRFSQRQVALRIGVQPTYLSQVASDLKYIIRERPVLYGRLIRTFSNEPDDSLLYVIDQAEQGYLNRAIRSGGLGVQ